MRLHARPVLQVLLFIAATVGATGLLVAAGLNEVSSVPCDEACQVRAAK